MKPHQYKKCEVHVRAADGSELVFTNAQLVSVIAPEPEPEPEIELGGSLRLTLNEKLIWATASDVYFVNPGFPSYTFTMSVKEWKRMGCPDHMLVTYGTTEFFADRQTGVE